MTRLQSLGIGAGIFKDWLGDGGEPVSRELAQKRTETCLQCPKNKEGDWFNRLSSEIVSRIMQQRRAKYALNLELKGEDGLHFCEVCQCDLTTKVWVPLKHIAKHTSQEVMSELPEFCWVKKEASA